MNHYWTADDHLAMRQAQIEDWLEDLAQFEVIDVKTACREWRRSNDRRPTPHNIRILAIAAQRERVPALPRPLEPLEPLEPPMSEEDPAYIEEGFAQMKAMLSALPRVPIVHYIAATADDVNERVALRYSPLTRDLIRQGLGGGE